MSSDQNVPLSPDAPSHYRISVVIPCYNAGAFLLEAIQSILRQRGRFELLEIIIVDDGSDDGDTRRALAQAAALPLVTVLANRGPRGAAAARNTGIDLARGPWIVFLDADDVLPDGSIDARCRAAQAFPDVGWIGGDVCLADREGKPTAPPMLASGELTRTTLAAAFLNGQPIRVAKPIEAFIRSPTCNTCSVLVRRDLLQRLGGFDPTLLRQHDYHLFLRLAALSDFVFTPHVVMFYRQHSSNSTRNSVELMSWRAKAVAKLRREGSFLPFYSQLCQKLSEIHLTRAYHSRQERKWLQAITSSVRSCYYAPSSAKAYRSLAASLLRR